MAVNVNLKAIDKAIVHNTAITAATDILSAVIAPVSGRDVVTFRVYVAVNTLGIFSIQLTRSSTTVSANLNGGASLLANALYAFDIPVHDGDDINFRHSVDATLLLLRVREIYAGVE